MTILELIESYGPAVFADPETNVIIQRNGAYLNWAVEGRDGWRHVDCRNIETDSYHTTLATAQDEAKAWFKEVMAAQDDE